MAWEERRCKKCGEELGSYEYICNNCRQFNPLKETDGSVFTGHGTAHEFEKNVKTMKIAAVVAVLFFAAIGGYIVANYGHNAYVSVEITSSHITRTVDVDIYIDGKYQTTWYNITPGSTWYSKYYFNVHFSLFRDAKLVTITAVSTGGGLGQQSDSKTLTVHNGGKYSVFLVI